MEEIRKKAFGRNELDNWRFEGEKITSTKNLKIIKEALEKNGPIFIQHWFYRKSRAPAFLLFQNFTGFLEYVQKNVDGGDAIDIWSILDICDQQKRLIGGKIPDEDGCIPEKGAY